MSDRMLLVDDHEVILEGIRTLIERSGRDWDICGTARNGKEGAEMARALRPDLVVMDVSMPVMNGIDAARQILHENKNSKILIFTMHESDHIETEAREIGARGVVMKSQAGRSLIHAIETVLAGKTFFGGSPDGETPEKPRQKKKFGSGPMRLFFESIS